MTTRILLLALAALLVTGCLKTRAELEAEQSGADQQRQTNQQQKAEAATAAVKPAAPYKEKAPATAYRFEEYDEQMRALAGRVEAVENSVQQTQAFRKEDREGANKNTLIIQEKFQAYEEALKKLDAQVQQLSEEVNKLKMAPTAPGPVHGSDANEAAAEKKATPKNTYEEGEELFGQKKWKEAVLKYQKYRDNNPKGTKYADATYKIGVSFQELGMKEEARSFYEEVVAKFPKAKEAKKASLRLKSLK